MPTQDMRFGTWNLECEAPTSSRGLRQSALIDELDVDLWALTEADPDSAPFEHTISSALIPGKSAAFAVLSSRWPIEAITDPNLPLAATALIDGPAGPIVAIAVCMPWRPDAPPLAVGAVPDDLPTTEHWHYVLARVDDAVTRISAMHPQAAIIVAGDFNQTLGGRNVGSARGREGLLGLLHRHALTAFTAEQPSAREGSLAIDHIIGPASWPASSAMHPVDGATGRALSDHAAYTVDLHHVPENAT